MRKPRRLRLQIRLSLNLRRRLKTLIAVIDWKLDAAQTVALPNIAAPAADVVLETPPLGGFAALGKPAGALGIVSTALGLKPYGQPLRFDITRTSERTRGIVGARELAAMKPSAYLVNTARASLVVFAIFYTKEMPNLTGFLTQVVSLENLEFLLVYFGVGFVFALLVFAVSVVSIPLMLDRNQDAITSMLASIRALAENPAPLLVWAALIVGLTLLGFMSFHIGLAVLMPLVGHATWHAYRDIVEPLKT